MDTRTVASAITGGTRRVAVLGAALALTLVVAGDGVRAASSATIWGQDPLEVLELKIRPNVIIVLDSSGSMTATPGGEETSSGDHPRSKLYLAKDVLNKIVTQNQDKVSFMLGTYAQNNVAFNNQEAGRNRFQYATTTMPATELTVRRATGDSATSNRGLQAWQYIDEPWSKLYFEEEAGATDAVCVASLNPGSFPKFYATGGPDTTVGTLAYDLKAAMNGATCTGTSRTNTYTVSYNTGTGVFTFARTATSTRQFRIRWDRQDAARTTYQNIRGALGNPTNNTGDGTSWSSNAPYTLLYRTTGNGTANDLAAPFSDGIDTDWNFTDTTGGVNTVVYNAAVSRIWNGEVVNVTSTGDVCGMTWGDLTKPPTFTVQAADASCTATGDKATFAFAGGNFGGNQEGDTRCRGFRSKSSLTPCDLQSPPAPLQMEEILPYIDRELPFAASGDPMDYTTNDATGNPGGTNFWVPDGIPDYVETEDGTWATQTIKIAPSAKADGYTPIANSLIDIKGVADAGDNECLINAAPASGKADPNSTAGTIGACVERNFSKMWNTGQTGATTMAGPGPWAISAIKDHGDANDPKEKTIVIVVTDGDDTCSNRTTTGSGANLALRAAYRAQLLYTPLDSSTEANAAASSVQTYVIGYGGGTGTQLNWIAWGGSGLGQPDQPSVATTGSGMAQRWDETSDDLTAKKGLCTTCRDAFIAPDPETLNLQLQGIIDQGSQEGDFQAQQSLTLSVFEYAGIVVEPGRVGHRSAMSPADVQDVSGRYSVLVPTLFTATFTLPGFDGQVRAYQGQFNTTTGAEMGGTLLRWSAGAKLRDLVVNGRGGTTGLDGMHDCGKDAAATAAGAAAGECAYSQLHGDHEAMAAVGQGDPYTELRGAIKRRIFTTSNNGVFPFNPESLIDRKATGRTTLWPPDIDISPDSDTSMGKFDIVLGLPDDAVGDPKAALEKLQKDFKACLGTNLPAGCTAGATGSEDWLTRMQAARREAREMILAFMAGAKPVPDGTGLKRTSAAYSEDRYVLKSSILYVARDWILADAELATPGIVTPPLAVGPKAYNTPEYETYIDGLSGNIGNPQLFEGFGLRNPDREGRPEPTSTDNDPQDTTRLALKPQMSVLYVPANDMLHAFRAGPNLVKNGVATDLQDLTSCYSPVPHDPAAKPTPDPWPTHVDHMASDYDCGGEELWGFVPYDQLGKLNLRYVNEPQGRDNHVFMLARGIRFADIFVPARDLTTGTRDTKGTFTKIVRTQSVTQKGVWRRMLFFGRGAGGKSMTALDVTGVGAFTRRYFETSPPIPLWNRGNPDTKYGPLGGTNNGSATDLAAYATMGETWSMPAVSYITASKSLYGTDRNPKFDPDCTGSKCSAGGPEFVLYMGSGYGEVGEGTTFYTLDALTGDVIATADVEVAATAAGLGRSFTWRNALVANAVGWNPAAFTIREVEHLAATWPDDGMQIRRVYIGDLYGRLWKILPLAPDVAIPMADLGADQPVATAVSVLALPHFIIGTPPAVQYPYVYVTSGADTRQTGPFKLFGFKDEGDDSTTTVDDAEANGSSGVSTFPPTILLKNEAGDYFVYGVRPGRP